MAAATSVLIGAAIAGGAVSAGAQIQQGRVAKRMADIESDQLNLQAQQAQVQAQSEKTQFAQEELQRQQALQRTLATQSAAFASSGLSGGSFNSVLGFENANTNNASRQASIFNQIRQEGFKINTAQIRTQASTTRQAGKVAKNLGYLNAGGSLLDTISKVYDYKNSSVKK